ncbi:hypothetical protein [Arthrobacter globiformis]|uniref:hypothetical protein n=1 Tax=Arthrobacter globiformis TaxID=1665 RepID=UPI002789ECB5|nr:hypothetical protein [Arthrobacter globiformis]MDQ0863799.1 hypothetical protein [Arthrobacter globiformis]
MDLQCDAPTLDRDRHVFQHFEITQPQLGQQAGQAAFPQVNQLQSRPSGQVTTMAEAMHSP